MKRLAFLLFALGLIAAPLSLRAEEEPDTTKADTTAAAAPAPAAEEEVAEEAAPAAPEGPSFTQQIKIKFVEGGVVFMGIVMLCLIFGLAIAIERIITLNLATTNTKKLLEGVENALAQGGPKAAQDYCAGIKGPVASIFAQGLLRSGEGIEMVEKSIVSYGSVEMGKLEKGLTWISLFIALAPMLGFMGTVIGMIDAFDQIMQQNDLQIAYVAEGIKVALLTTVAGLIVAVILQIFYNYLVSKIDGIVTQMEDASISLVDLLIARQVLKN